MTPWRLAAKNTESGHQKALFAWAAMARLNGFMAADDLGSYTPGGIITAGPPVPALTWLHAIPNGGFRDPATAALLKAEGVKPGIADIFLPFPKNGLHGLYIELKKPGNYKVSEEQKRFYAYCIEVQYCIVIAIGWVEGKSAIVQYLKD